MSPPDLPGMRPPPGMRPLAGLSSPELPGLSPPGARLLALSGPAAGGPGAAGRIGAKAARLAAASRAGLPVLPGWVVPVSEGRAAMAAGAAAVRGSGMAAGRRAVLSRPVDPVLAAELAGAVRLLGGRGIVRSSSPLEDDARWAGAFSSVAEVGPGDVATAVRSCWASAFAVDPLERLAACGLQLSALELGLVIQPELRPEAGGVARVMGDEVTVEGVAGHPGALLSGWAEGARARVRLGSAAPGPHAPGEAALGQAALGQAALGQAALGQAALGQAALGEAAPGEAALGQAALGQASPAVSPAGISDYGLGAVAGLDVIAAVAAVAWRTWRELGDDLIEWAVADDTVWLLQSLRSGPPLGRPGLGDARPAEAAAVETAAAAAAEAEAAAAAEAAAEAGAAVDGVDLAARQWMPLLAALAQARGQHVRGRPAVPGTAAGRLVACRPHERPGAATLDAILLIDRPLPALAPLLFGARGVIARAGAAGSHLAEVARSLGVPMVIGCRPDAVLGPDAPLSPDRAGQGWAGQGWIAAIDGAAGDVALLPAAQISST